MSDLGSTVEKYTKLYHDERRKNEDLQAKLKLHSVDLELLSTLTIKLKEAEERLKRTDLELRKAKGDIADAKLYYAEALKVVEAVREFRVVYQGVEAVVFKEDSPIYKLLTLPLPEGGSDG